MNRTKICFGCGQEKNSDDFSIKGMLKNGLIHLNPRCKPCKKKYDAEVKINNKSQYQNWLKNNNIEDFFIEGKLCLGVCVKIKPIKDFGIQNHKLNGEPIFRAVCDECRAIHEKEKRNKDLEKTKEKRNIYNAEHRDHINKSARERNAKLRAENKLPKSDPIKRRVYENNKRNSDPHFKFKKNIGRLFRYHLSRSDSKKIKSTKEIVEGLGYSIEEMNNYIENLFEPWMSWNNQGKYNSKFWDDNDQSTWVWNIDHIIPLSDLPCKSIYDENFKVAWSLKNIRPYSAKQNIIDGTTRIRHKGNKNE